MIDLIQQHLNLVQRQVGNRVLEAGECFTATISQSYDASVDDVWDACTNPERLPRWFMPVSGDLRAGGRYQLLGNAGGTIEGCDPPNNLAVTWEYGGDVSWVEVRLVPESDGRTRLEIQHTIAADDARWAEYGPGAVGVGWDLGLMALAIHLSSGQAVDTPATDGWMASEAGTRFIALCSQSWCDASVAAGADRSTAQAATDRTTAAYTVPAPAA